MDAKRSRQLAIEAARILRDGLVNYAYEAVRLAGERLLTGEADWPPEPSVLEALAFEFQVRPVAADTKFSDAIRRLAGFMTQLADMGPHLIHSPLYEHATLPPTPQLLLHAETTEEPLLRLYDLRIPWRSNSARLAFARGRWTEVPGCIAHLGDGIGDVQLLVPEPANRGRAPRNPDSGKRLRLLDASDLAGVARISLAQ